MMQSGAIQGPLGGETMYSRNDVSAHVHDLNVPYGGETPTADLIFAVRFKYERFNNMEDFFCKE